MKYPHPFFDANYWSCFQSEDEKLFLGGITSFRFDCIWNVPKSQKFEIHLQVIAILRYILNGTPLVGIKPAADHVSTMKKMIKAELDAVYLEEPYTGKLPLYPVTLFHWFVSQKTEIVIRWNTISMYTNEEIKWRVNDGMDGNQLKDVNLDIVKDINLDFGGLQIFRELFVSENGTLRMSHILNLCENAKSMVVMAFTHKSSYESTKLGYNESIALDDAFLTEILSSIQSLNERANGKFKEFVIVYPSGSISEFMNLHQKRFNEMGWNLEQKSYSHTDLPGEVPNSLWITRN